MNTFKAETRSMDIKAKRLRREGFVTGNVFGREIQGSIPVKMEKREAERLMKTCMKGSQIILEVDGQPMNVLIKEIDYSAMKNQIDEIVLGHPKNMDGSAGERAQKCEALAEDLRARTGLPVVLWDERRTTVAAHQILHASGKKAKKHRQTVDAVAASLILQGYLDFKRMRG